MLSKVKWADYCLHVTAGWGFSQGPGLLWAEGLQQVSAVGSGESDPSLWRRFWADGQNPAGEVSPIFIFTSSKITLRVQNEDLKQVTVLFNCFLHCKCIIKYLSSSQTTVIRVLMKSVFSVYQYFYLLFLYFLFLF